MGKGVMVDGWGVVCTWGWVEMPSGARRQRRLPPQPLLPAPTCLVGGNGGGGHGGAQVLVVAVQHAPRRRHPVAARRRWVAQPCGRQAASHAAVLVCLFRG